MALLTGKGPGPPELRLRPIPLHYSSALAVAGLIVIKIILTQSQNFGSELY
jgi:hypothetical protein